MDSSSVPAPVVLPLAPSSAGRVVLPLAPSSAGRVSGKRHLEAPQKRHSVDRSHLQDGVKTKWEDRVTQTKKAHAIKKLQQELADEKQAEIVRRREITQARKKAAAERARLEEDKAKMGARKAERMRRRAGRSKKVNG
ncbi:Cgr1 family-domain-containing protein [Roridomyces roridus]|uniref:rRNA-processing protein n=1 Tax=Roridomyces roridus TaxID=1738132 RepID=A0AAD7BU63_9AGAR|nr:Cgr1 family-domain-containing protein [Roridomyces roridus]